MERFEFVGKHCTDNGFVIDSFALFANVVSETEDTVTYTRYGNFGRIKPHKLVTVSRKEFERYYQSMTDALYAECLKGEAIEAKRHREGW